LAIARVIARGHDGEITVTSEPGRGSEFRVTLPVTAAPRDAIRAG
jgi:signal transduction histidine kinase